MAITFTRDIEGNYLCVRGEYCHRCLGGNVRLELPPRARRILEDQAAVAAGEGTTSACAENTLGQKLFHGKLRNYLRVRGEYLEMASHAVMIQELPPRARRIPWDALGAGIKYGTTSACAENTVTRLTSVVVPGNYLRVRGEYTSTRWVICTTRELPPRARRIPNPPGFRDSMTRTTSACAENTAAG